MLISMATLAYTGKLKCLKILYKYIDASTRFHNIIQGNSAKWLLPLPTREHNLYPYKTGKIRSCHKITHGYQGTAYTNAWTGNQLPHNVSSIRYLNTIEMKWKEHYLNYRWHQIANYKMNRAINVLPLNLCISCLYVL